MADAAQAVVRVATPIAIAVVEHNDCFLIGQRPQGVVLAGFWEFPGGKVHDGEEPSACAVRECREETGIEVQVVRLLHNCDYAYDHGRLHLQYFHCRPPGAAPEPRRPFLWVGRHNLNRYRFPPANEALLRILEQKCLTSI